jgi:hypothetical protein
MAETRRRGNLFFAAKRLPEFARQISRPFACLAGVQFRTEVARETREKARKRKNGNIPWGYPRNSHGRFRVPFACLAGVQFRTEGARETREETRKRENTNIQ